MAIIDEFENLGRQLKKLDVDSPETVLTMDAKTLRPILDNLGKAALVSLVLRIRFIASGDINNCLNSMKDANYLERKEIEKYKEIAAIVNRK